MFLNDTTWIYEVLGNVGVKFPNVMLEWRNLGTALEKSGVGVFRAGKVGDKTYGG